MSVEAGAAARLTATATDTSQLRVAWRVNEPGGGNVDSHGRYTAPQATGTYHIVATSVTDPTASATSTVTVSNPPPPSAGISVSVAPSAATVSAASTLTLTATVTNASNGSVTWTVQEGAAGGTVTADGVYTAPSSVGTYHVVATSQADSSQSATATVTVTAPPTAPSTATSAPTPTPTPTAPTPTAHTWDVTTPPPTLTNPVTITLPGNYSTQTISYTNCTGRAYIITLDNNTDYIVRVTQPITAPVHLNGGRNVRIIGMHLDMATADCGGNGAFGYVPTHRALNVSQVGTTFIEGAYIDLAGRAADCIVARNAIGGGEALSKGYSETDARGSRRVVVQNSVCRGYSGDTTVHGDTLQTQGLYELYDSITLENVSADSNCEGTTLEPRQYNGVWYSLANLATYRNFDYRTDSRYSPGLTGGAIFVNAKAYAYSNVFLSDWEGGRVYQSSIDESSTTNPCGTGTIYCQNSFPSPNRFAVPGTGAASSTWTGINYVSPY